jgi:DNA modification methylase
MMVESIQMKPASSNDGLQPLRELRPRSPKRSQVPASATWYGYYAGYADNFVADIVAALPGSAEMILDPWNGSGTTTAVATAASLGSRGFDINPAAVVIATARLLQSDVAGSMASLTEEILSSASANSDLPADSDLLHSWFSPHSVGLLRSLERRTFQLLVAADARDRAIDSVGGISALAAVFYLGLFRTIRTLLDPFLGSNPTWIRRNINPRNRLRPRQDTIHQKFRQAMETLTALVESSSQVYPDKNCPSSIALASSTDLPLEDGSVDAVITSPPYCTRIDYVVATLPELAVLGLQADELKGLRDRMIGTPTIPGRELETDFLADCPMSEQLLQEITAHESKASNGYYRKFFLGYLRGMNESIAEISRVAHSGAPVVFVVQDSYYKEIRVDLASLIGEMAEVQGLTAVADHNFEVVARRNYATINPRSRVYRESTPATESVLIMAGE